MIITVETDLKRPLYNKIDTIINILTVIITILDIIFLILDNSAYNDNLSIFCWCIFAPVPLFIMMLPENIYTWSNHTKLYLSVFVIGFVVYIFWFIWGGFLLNSNIYKKNYKYLYINIIILQVSYVVTLIFLSVIYYLARCTKNVNVSINIGGNTKSASASGQVYNSISQTPGVEVDV